MLAVSRPISEELRCRSQRAVGRRKDTHRISTASLALAQPHTNNKIQWKTPKPKEKQKLFTAKKPGRKTTQNVIQWLGLNHPPAFSTASSYVSSLVASSPSLHLWFDSMRSKITSPWKHPRKKKGSSRVDNLRRMRTCSEASVMRRSGQGVSL